MIKVTLDSTIKVGTDEWDLETYFVACDIIDEERTKIIEELSVHGWAAVDGEILTLA